MSTVGLLLAVCALSVGSASAQTRDPWTGYRADRACAKNIPPVAEAEFPQTVRVGETVTFNGNNSSDPDGQIYALYWSFGDGDTSRGRTVTHAYEATGTYAVALRVVDDCMASSPEIEGILSVVECLSAFDCDDGLYCTGVESCSPDGFCEEGTPPCTDDQTCDEANDECDGGGTGDPAVSFTFTPEAPQVHDVVTFNAACEWWNEYVIFVWSFSDGSTTYADMLTREFSDPLTYTFSLTAYDTNTGYYETVDGEITVLPGLTLLGLLEGDIGDARGLEVVGTTAWVAGGQEDGLGRFVTVDVSNPEAPYLSSDEQALYGYLRDLDVGNGLVAVAAAHGGVYLFDDNPASPSQVGHFDCYALDGSYAYGVALLHDESEGEDWLYVAAGGELKIVNVSDPGSPAWVGSVDDLGWLNNRVLIQDQYLYVGDSSTPAVRVLDITNPDNPLTLLEIPTDARPYDMCVRGSLLAVIENNIGQDPHRPGKLAIFELGDGPSFDPLSRVGNISSCYRSVALSEQRAFVTDMTSVVAFNIADPENPFYTEAVSVGPVVSGVRLGADGRVYTGLWGATLAVLNP